MSSKTSETRPNIIEIHGRGRPSVTHLYTEQHDWCLDKYPSESKTARLLEIFLVKAATALDRVDTQAIHAITLQQFMDPIQERWNPLC